MAAGGKGKSSRGRGRGRGRVRESSTGVQVFQGKNPVLGSSGHRASSHSSNPNSATQSHRSRPSQYPPATVPQTTPPQTTLTPTNSPQPLLSGSQQPPPVHRNLPPTRQRQAPTSQQQPPTCQQKAPSRQHQSLGLQQQPRQTEQQNPNNHEEEDGVEDWEEDGEEDGEEEEEEEEDPNSPEEDNPNVDYQDLLDSLLALPGLQQLPLLSEKPIPGVETLWFNRHKGKLSRVIAGIFRRKFDGPYFIWKVTPIHIQERYFKNFAHWNTKDAIERSENASQCRNSTRGGLGVHKHVAGQKSFLQVHQEMEERLKRPVTFGEVFIATHTRADGSFVDQKSQQVGEAYAKSLEERMSEIDRDGPQISDNYSQHSTQRTLSLEEKIFLKCTHKDGKGNPYGLGSLVETLNKRKRKECYASSSTSTIVDLQDQLQKKISKHEAQNAKRDEEHRQYQYRMEKLLLFMKEKDLELAAFLSTDSTEPKPPL